MNKIYLYPIKSMMSYGDLISKDSAKLIDSLTQKLNGEYEFVIVDDLFKVKDGDFLLILVQSGGSEAIFKKEIYSLFPGPFYLLTYGASNSLAASLEILTFLKDNGRKGEVLHGNDDYIADRIKTLYENNKVKIKPARLGVIGVPSDWLISSDVNYARAEDVFNIELVDIDDKEVVEEINKINETGLSNSYDFKYDNKELDKALRIHKALKVIVKKYNLDGFTIRCFDIIKAVKSSTCLSLALFNKEGIIASCEGDIPAMISAYVALKVLNEKAFQANPQWIDPVNNTVEFAHCTLPLDMSINTTLDTHFESGIGIGLHGELKTGDITILKINSRLDEFYVEEGNLFTNEYRKDRCRTQVKIKLNSDASYFLRSSLGNHHQIIYGHHKKELKEFLESNGLREVI